MIDERWKQENGLREFNSLESIDVCSIAMQLCQFVNVCDVQSSRIEQKPNVKKRDRCCDCRGDEEQAEEERERKLTRFAMQTHDHRQNDANIGENCSNNDSCKTNCACISRYEAKIAP